jgi:hypothetical protein
MKLTELTFSLGSTMPLRNQYANVKPHASAKIVFDEEVDPGTSEGKALVTAAFNHLETTVLNQIAVFRQNFRAAYGEDSID